MSELSRRNLLRRSAATATTAATAAGPALVSALGQNNKMKVGFIGVGGRGYYLMERLYVGSKDLVEVGHVCDTFQGHLARGKDRVQTMGGNSPKTTADYLELLADPSLDVVVIATPEHLHHSMALAALKAKKHIYLEKPIAHTVEEGAEIVAAAAKSGKMVQVGTQNRSNSLYIKARDMVKAGMIGDVHYVRAFWYRNSLDDNPAWRYNIPKDANEQNTDWKRFLGPAKNRPFDKRRYYQWRLYSDYSSGIATDLLVHQTDITNFMLGKTEPSSCVASGGVYRWTQKDDDREVADCMSAIYEYPGGFHLNYSCYFGNENYGYGEQLLGNEGTIEVLNRSTIVVTPEKFRGNAPPHVKARKEERIDMPGNDNKAVEAHLRNLLDSIAGKAQLTTPPKMGQQAAIGGHLATMSMKTGKKVLWEEKTQKYRFA